MSKKCSYCNKPIYRNNLNRIKERHFIQGEKENETIVIFNIFCNQECKKKFEEVNNNVKQ